MPFLLLYVFRTGRVTIVSAFCAAAFLILRIFGGKGSPQLLRWYFETCGAGFVKVGQLLAMRYDLLPERYCDELGKLLDRMPPVPAHEIVAVIEQDLGRSLGECFAEFDPNPLAAASIAQVHRAVLSAGKAAAVKVMRPGVQDRFRIDLANLGKLAYLVDWLGIFPDIDVQGMVDVLIRATGEELDFRREARNIQTLHLMMLEDDVDHYAPSIYMDLCGRHVITMELLKGVWLNEMIAAVRLADHARLEAWAARGITPQRTALLIMRSMLEQFFHYGLFHADPHAANLVVLDGGTLGFVDFGMTGRIDERVQEQQLRLRQAIAAGNVHAAYQAMLDTLEPLPSRDLSRFELEFKELVHDWLFAIQSPTATLLEKSTGGFLLRIFAAVRHAGLSFPLTVVRLQRAYIVADVSMLVIAPEVDWIPELRRFIINESHRRALEALKSELSPESWATTALHVARTFRLAGDFVDWARDRLPDAARRFQEDEQSMQRVAELTLRYARGSAVILALVFGVGSLVTPQHFAGTAWNRIVDIARPWQWWISGGALVFAGMLSRILRQIKG